MQRQQHRGYSDLNVDGGHTVHQYVLSDGDYTIDFSDYGVAVSFSYVLRLDGAVVHTGSTLSDFNFTVGSGSVYGCTDGNALNFDPEAHCNDGSCEYSGTCPFGNSCVFEVDFLNSAIANEYACFMFFDFSTYSIIAEGCVYEAGGLNAYAFCIPTGCYSYLYISGYEDFEWRLYDGNGQLAQSGNGGDILYNFCIDAGTASPPGCNDPLACNYNAGDNNNQACRYASLVLLSVLDADGAIETAGYTVTDFLTQQVEFSGTLVEGSSTNLCHASGHYCIDIIPLEGFMHWQIGTVTGGTIGGNSAQGGGCYTTDGSLLPGCTHTLALNYLHWATVNDGSCIFPIPGCMDPSYCNYNPMANVDDGNCMNGEHVITLQLIDLGADGLEGAYYHIRDTLGNVWAQGTYNGIASDWSNPYTTYFCLPDGCYEFSIGGGTDDGELYGSFSGVNNSSNTFGWFGGVADFDFYLGQLAPAAGLFIEMYEIGSGQFNQAGFTLVCNNQFFASLTTWSSNGHELWFECLPPDGCYELIFTSGISPQQDVLWKVYGTDQGVLNGTGSTTAYFTFGGGLLGCTNPSAYNYNPMATCDNATCAFDQTGDFNSDGIVNISDLLLFMAQYGCNTVCELGDLNFDGIVNTTDLLSFLSFYGN